MTIYQSEASDVQTQAKIYRGNQVVRELRPKRPDSAGSKANQKSISMSDELPINGLPPGSYTLEVTATDRATSAGATQRVTFWIQ